MHADALSGEVRVQSWRVFLLVLLSASYFFQSGAHNEAARFDQMRSVVEHGEWWIDRFAANTSDVIQRDGHTYPNKAPGTTLLGLLPWMLARGLAAQLHLSIGGQIVIVTWLLTILMSALPTAFTSLLIVRFLARGGWTEVEAAVGGLAYGLGTLAFPFATLFFGHQLAAGFAFGAFYLVWSAAAQPNGVPWRIPVAGALIGFLPVIEYTGAIASGLIAIYGSVVLGLRSAWKLWVTALVAFLPLPFYNLAVLGSAGSLSYSFYSSPDSAFPAHRVGFMGVSWPRLDVLKEITFRPKRGLFYANPWLAAALLSPFLLKSFTQVRRELILFTAIALGFLGFNAGFGDSIVYWGGAFSFGPRHLLIALPFLACLAMTTFRHRMARVPVIILVAITALLMIPPTAIDPRLPYDPPDPFLSFYLPLFDRGLHSSYFWNTFGEGVVAGGTGAFNVGRLLGLARDLELVPVGALWAAGAFAIFRSAGLMARTGAIAFGIVASIVCTWPAFARLESAERGLCRVASSGNQWRDFDMRAFDPDPGPTLLHDVVHRVETPPMPDTPLEGALAPIALTFRGHYTPPREGAYLFRLEATGDAALYIDGYRRVVVGSRTTPAAQMTLAYLSTQSHEIIVRYMTDRPERHLRILSAFENEPLVELLADLTTRGCR